MTDYKALSDVLVAKAKVRGKPVAVSLFSDRIPPGYEPIQDTPCAIIRYAMDEGRKVYFDADHHDCLVGVHHAGIVPGKPEIVNGEYLSRTSTFFTHEGAARLKSGSFVLPPGMVKAIGAAPLDDVPKGVAVDWVVAVTNPHNANNIAGCRACREGILPHAEIANSLCVTLFATPWHVQNVVFATGDFGGRMHNRMKQDQVFVVVPRRFLHYVPMLLNEMKVDVKESRKMTKPTHSAFWREGSVERAVEASSPDAADTGDEPAVTFTMDWDDEAREMMKKVPEGILEMAVGNAEDFARQKGYPKVTKTSIQELMESLGMNLDDML